MAKPYSRDLRERMVRAVQAGRSRHEVARMFEVSASCVIKLMQRYEATGDCEPGKFGGHRRPALTGYEDRVRALVAEHPDLTVTEIWRKLTTLDIEVGRSAVGRFLQRLRLTFKKNSSRR
jgi:transposase